MENNMSKIAVLLTCHNRREKTLSCLHSLFGATLPAGYKTEVFLVDDGSTDGTGEAVKKSFPQVIVIRGDGNLYWNKGMNLAWRIAVETSDYDFYLWLNDDVILKKESIEIFLKDFRTAGTNNAIIAGACQSGNGMVTYSGYNSLTKKIKVTPNSDIQQCEYFNGNAVLVPSFVFKQVGFLDSLFHHGQGDFDYGLKAKKAGIQSFVSSGFVGVCERNIELPRWCNPRYPLPERLKSFNSPLGGRPGSTFIFQKRYIGFIPALFHYFTIHLRLVFPGLWAKKMEV
jgi:GT2 family glycosyltransferase